MELRTIRYEELQDHAERDLVKRAMQLSRYEIPDLAGSDPGKYPIQGTLCITEEPVQEYLYAGNAGQLALLTDQWIRKKAISRNIFKKRQEDFLQKYAEVTALRETLQQLQQLCKERQELTSMQDAVKNSLLVSDHERRTIFLKNKIAQRKYLGRELERKQHQSEDIEKKLGHRQRQAAQKQAQIKDTENRIATTYAGVFARFLHRREAEAETAPQPSQFGIFPFQRAAFPEGDHAETVAFLRAYVAASGSDHGIQRQRRSVRPFAQPHRYSVGKEFGPGRSGQVRIAFRNYGTDGVAAQVQLPDPRVDPRFSHAA